MAAGGNILPIGSWWEALPVERQSLDVSWPCHCFCRAGYALCETFRQLHWVLPACCHSSAHWAVSNDSNYQEFHGWRRSLSRRETFGWLQGQRLPVVQRLIRLEPLALFERSKEGTVKSGLSDVVAGFLNLRQSVTLVVVGKNGYW